MHWEPGRNLCGKGPEIRRLTRGSAAHGDISMNIVVFGKSGQLATELSRMADVRLMGRDVADFADPDGVAQVARTVDADVFINAAAYTAVDRAEDEEALATVINGSSVGALAREASKRSIPLIHVSTDYVFDGSGNTAWKPDQRANPASAYGRSKLAGEQAIVAARGPHAILRTSWVFSTIGKNFVKSMLRKAADGCAIDIVDDQVGGPTPAIDLAGACLEAARQLHANHELSGTYHFSGAPDVSWAGFAEAIFASARYEARVNRVLTKDFPTPAKRPANSRLDCSSLEKTFGIERPDWRVRLDQTVQSLLAEI